MRTCTTCFNANGARRHYTAYRSHLSLNKLAKNTRNKETQCHKPDPDTSSWLKTFLITNSCLWVTRPAAQHKAVLQLSVSVAFHFQEKALSQCSVHECPGLLCKSNCFNTGPPIPSPSSSPSTHPQRPSAPSHTSDQQSCVKALSVLQLFQLTTQSTCRHLPRQLHQTCLSFTD